MAMERMWLDEADMKYPKQFFVAVNLGYDEGYDGCKIFGDIYGVYPNHDSALEKMRELDKLGTMGETTVGEGFDDTPQIGGLFRNDID
ncbi:MAG: hypothetical protein FWG90_12640 [Oscillospiraceae bacterium]|nr:hypothetical protein [Oscillospiraceae bacterium]